MWGIKKKKRKESVFRDAYITDSDGDVNYLVDHQGSGICVSFEKCKLPVKGKEVPYHITKLLAEALIKEGLTVNYVDDDN